ncbi:MAG: THUMP domain-containing protein [Candidatus Kariarchaeaceae archaeon]
MIPVILVRYGEISLKSKATIRRMIRHLTNNIRIALTRADIAFDKISFIDSRVIVYTDLTKEGAKIIAERVPGVVSTSSAFLSKTSYSDIQHSLNQVLTSSFFDNTKTFAIRVNRVGKHDFSSREMTLWLAEQVYNIASSFNCSLEVDLGHPDLKVSADIRRNNTFIYFDKVAGVGGLPMGSQEDAIAIIRGFYEDYIAATAVMKRGVILKIIVFSEYPAFQNNKEENEAALEFLNLLQPRQPKTIFAQEKKDNDRDWSVYIQETAIRELKMYGARGLSLFSSDDREWVDSFPPGLSIYEPLFAIDLDEILNPFSFFNIKW